MLLRRMTAAIVLVALTGACSEESAASCDSESDEALCGRLALDCGLVTGSDTCGRQRTVNCGSCPASQTCGGSGVENVCSGGGAAGTGGAGGASCTAQPCPTESHWLRGTFTFDDAAQPSNRATGELLPLIGKTMVVLVQFDQGAEFKDPPANDNYVVRVVTTLPDILHSDDPTGLFDSHTGLIYKGTIRFDHSTQVDVFGIFEDTSAGGYTLKLGCDNVSLPVGADQYVMPGPVSCAVGWIRLSHYKNSFQSDYVTGTGPVEYH